MGTMDYFRRKRVYCVVTWFLFAAALAFLTPTWTSAQVVTVLAGTVTDNSTGQPISGAAVTLYAAGLVTVNTDANGNYAFSGTQWPYTGSAELWIVAPGYFTPVLSVNLAAPFPVTLNRALIPGGPVVSGTVTDANSGLPIAGASVEYRSGSFYPGAGTRGTQTDSNGNYSIDSSQFTESVATAGTQLSLIVSSSGYLQTTATVQAAPPYPTTQNFSLTPDTQTLLQGTVTNQATGQPISGAAVTLYASGLVTVNTDANGNYAFSGTQWPYTGSAELWIVAPGYFTPVLSVNLVAPFPVTLSRALIPGGPVVSGTVTDANSGLPIAGANVEYSSGSFYPGAGTRVTQTDLGGHYSVDSSQFIESVATSGAVLSMSVSSQPGYFQAQATVSATPPYPQIQNFGLTPTGATQSITIATNPADLNVTVDGTAYTAPQVFAWVPGNPHTVATSSPQAGTPGTQYVFADWDNVAATSQTIVTPAANTTYTASFTTQYQLTTNANPASEGVISAGGWFNSGSIVSVQASANAGYQFTGFSGNLSGTGNPQNLMMSTPENVTANFASLATTSTALSSSANSSLAGSSVTFSATVTTGNGNATPTGSVTFMDGATSLGTVVLNASGVAIYSTTSLTVGSHTILAMYGGDAHYQTSTSSSLVVVIEESAAVTLLSSANPILTGTSVTFTATVKGSASGSPTGGVSFQDGSNLLGTAKLNSSGVAALSVLNLTPGQHSITANYGGDTTNLAATSSALTETVQQNTTTALASSANPSFSGASVTFTATVMPASSGTPTGSVTFRDGNTVLGSATLSASGVATYSSSALVVGSHTVTAVYGGDTINLTSTSTALSQAVSPANFTVNASPTSQTIAAGQTATFTLTVTPQGSFMSPVSFACGNLPRLASCTFSPSQLTPDANSVMTTLTITTIGRAGIAPQVRSLTPRKWPNYPLALFASGFVLAAIIVLFNGTKRLNSLSRFAALAALLFLIVGSLAACAGSEKPMTPASTTQLQVTASSTAGSGNMAHSATLTLIVQ